ncbi:OmpA family protein [Pedobacter psychroterrae]|uniref:OmpA family protein n=1 Tax=Pedobacter psychroterrae TaxID=2530453 RepID=A0A4R0NPV9_9SPHI|nr:OmpA family protein [Pedobacter psychroterrae]TCD03052.1 OmpA family protein [Pedobacter psychroterrae]
MKRLIFTLAMVLIAGLSWAQVASNNPKPVQKGQLQIAAFGGLSMPQGNYKGIPGRAKNGYVGGLAVDQYFKGNKWGIGVDGRFLNHDIRKFDSVFFDNGYIATDYINHPSFQHIAVSIGPTYKSDFGKIELEAFLRGGVMFQGFPQYKQSVFINQAVGPPVSMFDSYYTNNPKRITKAWMGLGGLRMSYKINRNWGVFVQGDYLRSFGKSFGSDSSEFHLTGYNLKKSLTPADVFTVKGDRITNLNDYFEEKPVVQKTYVQAVNVAVGVKFTFGKSKVVVAKPKDIMSPVVQAQPKDILVVVKDKQTGQALSGVTVTISRNGGDNVSISNSNGEAERLVAAERGQYQVTAVKNGIAAAPVLISEAEFEKSGKVIYKEIFHDDPRFTLIGETVSASDNVKLPGISTVLTNTTSNSNMSQISDTEAKFVYQLEQQSTYTIVANQAGKFSQTEEVTTKGLNRSKTLYVSLKLGINNLNAGTVIVLKNIYYDFDKSNIRSDAARILDNVLNVMIQNPTLNIELSSHTDSRGKDGYNMQLSQKRAEAAVNYLVGKGIARTRLEAKGYGETKLLNNCENGVACSEEAHQVNRRTEIKVLKY